jgi:diguanylate cyclase (GGDEF)-like protein
MTSETETIGLPTEEKDLASLVGKRVLEDMLAAIIGYLPTRAALFDPQGRALVELSPCEYCQALKGRDGFPVCNGFYSSFVQDTARTQTPLERSCPGGCLMHSEPVLFGGHTLGVLLLCLSAPPTDPAALAPIADAFSLPGEVLLQKAGLVPESPEPLVLAARDHLAQTARLIPELYRAVLAERKARELAAIQAIVATVSQAKDAKSLAKRAMETILELMHLEIGGLALFDPHKNELVSAAIIGLPPEFAAHFARIPLQEGSGIAAQVAQTRQPLLVTDVSQHSFTVGNSPQVIEQLQISSLLMMPLQVAGEFVGGIEVAAQGDRRFTPEDLDLLASVATPLGVGLRRLLLQEDLQNRNQELLALNSIAASISRSLNLDVILHDALDNVMELFQAQGGTLYLVDEKEGSLALRAHRNAPEWYLSLATTLPFGKGIAGKSAKQGGLPGVGNLADLYKDHPDLLLKMEETYGRDRETLYIAVPLLSKDRAQGVLHLVFPGPREFRVEELNLLAAIGSQIGAAIENARLYEAERRQRAQLAGLSEIIRALLAEHDLGSLLKMIVTRATEVMHAQATSLFLWDEAEEYLVIRASQGLSDLYVAKQRIPRNRVANLESLPDGRFAPQVVPDLATQSRGDRDLAQGEGLRSLLSLPLSGSWPSRRRGLPIGILNFYSKTDKQTFRTEEVELAAIFADQAAVALDNARLLAERERRIAQLGVLNQISQAISATLRFDQLLDLIYWQVSRVMDTSNFYIALAYPEKNLLSFEYFVEDRKRSERESRQMANGLTEYILRTKRPLLLSANIAAACRDLGVELLGRLSKSYLGVPMIIGENVVGVLAVQSYAREEAYGMDDQELLATIATQAAIAVENARLYEATSQRMKEIGILYRIAQSLSTSLDLDSLLANFLEVLNQELGYRWTILLLVDREKNELFIRACPPDYPQEVQEKVRFKIGAEGISGHVALTGEPVVLSDVTQDPRYAPGLIQARSEIAVPLKIGGEVIGVLDIEDPAPGAFGDRDLRLLSSLAAQVAIAIENARLYQATSERAKELAILYDIGRNLTLNLDLDSLLDQILGAMQESFGYLNCAILLLDREKNELFIKAARGYTEEVIRNRRIRIGEEGITGWVAARGEPLNVPDVTRNGRYVEGAVSSRSELAVPLRIGKEVIGVLDVESQEVAAFQAKDLRMLTSFAAQAAIAIENARLYANLEARVHELDLLTLITGRINAGLGLEKTLETVVDEIRKVIPYDTAILYFSDSEGTTLHPQIVRLASAEYPQDYIDRLRTFPVPFGKGLVGWSAKEKEPLNCPNVLKDPRRLDLPETPSLLSVLTVPFVVEQKTIGALALSQIGERRFAPSDLRLLRVLADDCAIAIHKARLFDETQRLAILDGLTGLANSRHFYNELKKEMERAERYSKPVSLILFDIDDFKKVNDSLGHQVGDNLLRELAQILPTLTRKSDLLARYGGEEFAVLLPETSREHALATAERIRAKVEGHVYPGVDLPRGRMTISLGVATYPYDAATHRDFVRAADIALYAAKRAGKNRVFSYETLSLKQSPAPGGAGGEPDAGYEFRGSPGREEG